MHCAKCFQNPLHPINSPISPSLYGCEKYVAANSLSDNKGYVHVLTKLSEAQVKMQDGGKFLSSASLTLQGVGEGHPLLLTLDILKIRKPRLPACPHQTSAETIGKSTQALSSGSTSTLYHQQKKQLKWAEREPIMCLSSQLLISGLK